MHEYRGLLLPCPGTYGLAVRKGQNGTREGVFERDDAGGAGMNVRGEDGMVLDVRECEMSGVGGENAGGEGAGEGGDTTGFPFDCRN